MRLSLLVGVAMLIGKKVGVRADRIGGNPVRRDRVGHSRRCGGIRGLQTVSEHQAGNSALPVRVRSHLVGRPPDVQIHRPPDGSPRPQLSGRVQEAIDPLGRDLLFRRHGLKARHTGHRLLVEVHLLSPFAVTQGEARRRATVREDHLVRTFGDDVHIITHLESSEDHGVLHGRTHRAA